MAATQGASLCAAIGGGVLTAVLIAVWWYLRQRAQRSKTMAEAVRAQILGTTDLAEAGKRAVTDLRQTLHRTQTAVDRVAARMKALSDDARTRSGALAEVLDGLVRVTELTEASATMLPSRCWPRRPEVGHGFRRRLLLITSASHRLPVAACTAALLPRVQTEA